MIAGKLKHLRRHGVLGDILAGALVALAVIAGVSLFAKSASASWFNESWLYRKAVSVANIGILQTDFQVSFSIDTASLITAGKMKSDCGDLRITDASGNILPYWIEESPGCNNSATKVWTKIPFSFLTGSTVYAYYGNPSASDAQSPSKVFEFFDDFKEASVDTQNRWNTSGSPSISGGALSLVNNAKLASKNALSNTNGTRILGMRAKVSSTNTSLAKLGFSDTNTLSSSFDSNDTAAVMVGSEQAYHTFIDGANMVSYHQLEETTSTDANQFKPSGYLDTGKLNQAVSMYGNAAGTTGSTLTFNRGAQISGNNYEHINSNQGTISFWIKPNWNGNDGTAHAFLDSASVLGSTGEGIRIWKYYDNKLYLQFQDGNTTPANVSVSSWTSGSWYHVVARYSVNKIDGTNYSSLTVNGVETDSTNAWIAATPGRTLSIGSSLLKPATNALIDDFAIYDRVLTTTEIAALYNSGTGNTADTVADSSLKFYAKMDGSGTLSPVTYNGGASASKMTRTSSELTGGTNLVTDGNMEAAGTTNWPANGSPIAVAKSTAKVFADTQSLKVTANSNGQGVSSSFNVSGSTSYHLTGWTYCDSPSNTITMAIADNGTNIPGFGNSVWKIICTTQSWSQFAADFKTSATASSATIFIAANNPSGQFDYYLDNFSVVPSLVDNGGMEGTYVSGLAPGWTKSGNPTVAAETTIVHSGSESQKVTAANNEGVFGVASGLSTSSWYMVSGWVYVASGQAKLNIEQQNSPWAAEASPVLTSGTGSWQKLSTIYKPTQTSDNIIFRGNGTATFYIDDVSVIPLDNTALSFKSWTPVSEFSSSNNQLSVQGSLTGVSSGTGKYGNGYTFDGSTGYLRQKTYAVNIGDLSYSGNTLTDTGQTFTSYKTSSGNASYMIVVTNSDNTTSWGYIGNNSEAATAVTVYTTKARSTAGWLGTSPTGKTPVGYEIRKTDYQITGSLTLGAWVKRSNAGYRIIMSKGVTAGLNDYSTVYHIGFDLNNYPYFDIGNRVAGTQAITDTSWHYIVGSYTPNTSIYLYFDGNLIASQTSSVPASITDTGGPFNIGTYQNNRWGLTFGGTIDSPFVLNKALTADQIKALYNVSSPKYGLANSSAQGTTGFGDGSSYSIDTNYHTFEITQKSSSVDYSVDGGSAITSSTNPPSSNEYIRLENSDTTNTVSLDYLYVRKTYSTSPTTSVSGTEEQGPGPVGYWKFDEGQGTTAKDSSSSQNNGTITGATWQTEDQCISGKCLYFDGSTSFIYAADNANLESQVGTSGKITISAWINTKSLATQQDFVAKYENTNNIREFDFQVLTTGQLRFLVTDAALTNYDSVKSTHLISTNTWTHVVAVYDNSQSGVVNKITLYINGKKEVGTEDIHGGTFSQISDTNARLTIGSSNQPAPANLFKGFLDEVKIYPYARSLAQIRADYLAGQSKAGSSVIASAAKQSQDGPGWMSNGLVGYWKMDETSGNAVDSSGNGNTGTWNGTGTSHYSAGKFSNGGGFNGTDDYVDAGTSTTLQPSNTVSFGGWVKWNSFPNDSGGHAVLSYSNSATNGFMLYQDTGTSNNNKIRAFIVTSNGIVAQTDSNLLNTGQWYHVFVTYNGSNLNIYLNGVLTTTRPATGTINWSSITNHFLVGSAYTSSGSKFNGSIDEARIYNRALSPKEVSDLYNWAPGPVGYWKMDDGTGTTVTDSSGDGFNGTWGSGGATHWTTGKYGKAGLFSGANNDQVNIGDISSKLNLAVSTPPSFTLSAWLNPVTGGSDLGGITPIDNYARMIYRVTGDSGNGKVGCQLVPGSTNVQTTNAIPLNSWSYVSCVYDKDAGLIKTYLNGVLQGSAAPAITDLSAAAKSFLIGHAQGDFKGSIDDVKIYNYARTPSQILADMGTGQAQKQPLAYYKFDEGYGTTANNSGNGGSTLNGTISTGPTWSDGKYGRALKFISASGTVTVNDATPLDPSTISVSTWVKLDSASGSNTTIAAKRTGFANNDSWVLWRSGSTGKIAFNVSTNGVNETGATSITVPVVGTWYHISGTYDGANVKIYVNGVLEATTAKTGNLYVSNASLLIGSGPGERWVGNLDEFKIYNYALVADEVKAEYNHGSSLAMGALSDSGNGGNSASAEYCIPGDTSTCSAPVGRWDFEEGTGGTVNDTSGNSNTGTWNGTGSHWATGKVGKAGQFTAANSDYVDVGNKVNPGTNDITVEAWVKPDLSNRDDYIASKIDGATTLGWYFLINYTAGDGKLYAVFEGTTLGAGQTEGRSSGSVASNVWSHVAFTFRRSDNTLTFYINGVPQTTTYDVRTLSSSADISTALSFYIGRHQYTLFNKGSIDNLRYYNYVRTPAQIAWDYNKGAPVGWWKMDECQGATIHDSSGNSNNGTITVGPLGSQSTGGTCTAPTNGTGAWYNGKSGKRNYSLNFDGTDDYISISNSASINSLPSNSGYTVSAWFNRAAFDGSNNFLLVNGDGSIDWNLDIIDGTNSELCRVVEGGTQTVGTALTISNGTWNHIVCVWNGSQLISYGNGKLLGQTPANHGALRTVSHPFTIGGRFSNGVMGEYFNGQIDDVKIFNYALTATQVKNEYNSGAVNFGPSTGGP